MKRLELTTTQHDCDVAGLTYVYAVRSRRAGGISIGINLSPNNACNWRCVYCQVEGLVRGASPSIALDQLESELQQVLGRALRDELATTEGASNVVRDVAFAGNGEPTTCPDFLAATERVVRVLEERQLSIPIVVITNGSMLGRETVQEALRNLSKHHGVVWFKLDLATDEGMLSVNGTHVHTEHHLARLKACAQLCPTWVQSCFFARKEQPPAAAEVQSYVAALEHLVAEQVPIKGVLLYTIARKSEQPEGPELSPLSVEWLDAVATRLRAVGVPEVRVSARS